MVSLDGGGLFGKSLRGVIEDSRFTEPIVHYELLHDSSDTGYEQPEFGQPHRMEAQVTEPDAEDFEITATGPDDDLQYVLTAMTDAGLSDDDRVWYNNGLSVDAYRLTSPRTVRFDGDSFVSWSLIVDERGEGAGGTGDSPDSDGDTGGTGDGSDSGDEPVYW